eukprot:4501191-Prymnesium_polylepis.2
MLAEEWLVRGLCEKLVRGTGIDIIVPCDEKRENSAQGTVLKPGRLVTANVASAEGRRPRC